MICTDKSINETMALRVMGWHRKKVYSGDFDTTNFYFVDNDGQAMFRCDMWNPRENIDDAYMCVKSMGKKGYRIGGEAHLTFDEKDDMHYTAAICTVRKNGRVWTSGGENPADSIVNVFDMVVKSEDVARKLEEKSGDDTLELQSNEKQG